MTTLSRTLLKKYNIAEYYLIDEYGSHFLCSKKFNTFIFLVLDERGISMFNDEVIGSEADFKLVREHMAIPFFGINTEIGSTLP